MFVVVLLALNPLILPFVVCSPPSFCTQLRGSGSISAMSLYIATVGVSSGYYGPILLVSVHSIIHLKHASNDVGKYRGLRLAPCSALSSPRPPQALVPQMSFEGQEISERARASAQPIFAVGASAGGCSPTARMQM